MKKTFECHLDQQRAEQFEAACKAEGKTPEDILWALAIAYIEQQKNPKGQTLKEQAKRH